MLSIIILIIIITIIILIIIIIITILILILITLIICYNTNGIITANLPTNIVDFRGFDSSIILILRGGMLMSLGNFPESLSQAMSVGIMLVGRLGVLLLLLLIITIIIITMITVRTIIITTTVIIIIIMVL